MKMVTGQNGNGQNGMDKMVQFYILWAFKICWIQYKFSNQKSQINDEHIEES